MSGTLEPTRGVRRLPSTGNVRDFLFALTIREDDYDWLEGGRNFWEHGPQSASKWA
jgi:hypothetical protein